TTIEQLTKERDDAVGLGAEWQRQLAAERERFSNDFGKVEEQLAQSIQSRNEHARLAEERKAKIEQMAKERETEARQASARQARMAELESRVTELAEIERRQAQLVEEITRAEGQIDLIKDVLIRE